MFGFRRKKLIAQQVSASLQDPTEFSEQELIEPSAELQDANRNGAIDDAKEESKDESRAQNGEAKTQPGEDIPSLEECLYGTATMKSPFIPENEEELEDGESSFNTSINNMSINNMSVNDFNMSINDTELNTRWSENPDIRADYHDIDMAVLRKLCSQGSGIPEDEGPSGADDDDDSEDEDSNLLSNGPKTRGTCHRGIAWRVLLEQLPIRDVHATWPMILPPQRKLYREMLKKYMDDAIDPGKYLKGESHWEQSLRMQNDSSNSSSTDNKGSEHTEINKGDGENDAAEQSYQQQEQASSLEKTPSSNGLHKESIGLDSSSHIRATEDIYDMFPSNSAYKELWLKTGISLNLGDSAAAIGMNRLKVPEELLVEDSDNESENCDESKNTNEGKEDVELDEDEISKELMLDNDEVKSDIKLRDISNKSGGAITRIQRNDIFEQFCKDAKLLSEIRKDVVRTNPHLRFYLETRDKLGIRRHAALERILFVWAKLNRNLYVQGMNEIVGTIYYVLAMDPTTSSGKSSGSKKKRQHVWAGHAEADTYYLFNVLMNTMEVRDVFVASLDNDASSGLNARIKNIEMLLKEHDPEIFNHLKGNLNLDSTFYAIRWLTTLLSREFRLPDTIRLWDSMLASTHKENFLRYVCASMVMAVRDRLLGGDFGTCLKLLQNYPSGEIGMDELLESSRALYIYETQILMACQKGGISLRKALNLISPPEGVIMAFGQPGVKPFRLGSGTVQNPDATSTQEAKNKGNLMGRLLGWRSPARKERKAIEKEDTEGPDLIDSIIDGETEFVSSSMTVIPPTPSQKKEILTTHVGELKDPAIFVTPPASPTKSSEKLWNSFRPSDILDVNDDVEDFSNNNGSESFNAIEPASGGFWNRIRRSY